MSRGIHRSWLLAGLAVFGAMFVGGTEARAAGIVITRGSTQPIGDPTFEYIFDIVLQAGSTLDYGGYITVYDLPGVNLNSTTQQGSIDWGDAIQLIGLTPNGASVTDDPSIYNVTWEYLGSTMTVTSDTDLGTFTITTNLSYAPTPTLVYVGSLDGVNASNQGSITVAAVPEPASVILLAIGAGALPLSVYRRRPHRSARSA